MERSGLGQILRFYLGIHLDRLEKTKKNLSQDSQSKGQACGGHFQHTATVSTFAVTTSTIIYFQHAHRDFLLTLYTKNTN
jgi:hypothetical protein